MRFQLVKTVLQGQQNHSQGESVKFQEQLNELFYSFMIQKKSSAKYDIPHPGSRIIQFTKEKRKLSIL